MKILIGIIALGVFMLLWSCCVAAGKADNDIERYWREHDEGKND